jgi:Raf kinase inhibitor-like YbhB/YbcL family protein
MGFTLLSEAIRPGGVIPRRHTGDGEDLSPPLTWSGVPAGTKELALVVDDPDAPSAEPWVHWVIYKLDPAAGGIAEGVPPKSAPTFPAGSLQGKNSWGSVGYRGPHPPRGHGVHHYHFRLFAVDRSLELAPGLEKAELLRALEGHLLGETELIGTYQR